MVRRAGPDRHARGLAQSADRLATLEKLRVSLDPDGPLERGSPGCGGADGRLRSAAAAKSGETVRLGSTDGGRAAVIDGAAAAPSAPPPQTPPRRRLPGNRASVLKPVSRYGVHERIRQGPGPAATSRWCATATAR